MSYTITISDEQFQALQQVATQRGETPEALVKELFAQLEAEVAHPIFDNADDWFRHLGMSEEEIQEAKRLAALDNDADEDANDIADGSDHA